jgi:hypothetical protein
MSPFEVQVQVQDWLRQQPPPLGASVQVEEDDYVPLVDQSPHEQVVLHFGYG